MTTAGGRRGRSAGPAGGAGPYGPARPPERFVRGDLLVRRWRRTDVLAMAAAVAESVEHLRPWMPWVAFEPLSPADRQALLGRWDRAWQTGEEFNYALFAGGRVVGSCGMMRRIGPGGIEIGYWVHPRHLRRGYATVAAASLTDAAFGLPGVTHVEIHHDVANVASGRVPERLGFGLVGDEPRPAEAPGETGTNRVWRLARDAWRPYYPDAVPEGRGDPGSAGAPGGGASGAVTSRGELGGAAPTGGAAPPGPAPGGAAEGDDGAAGP